MVEVTHWEMLQVNFNGCDWPICGMWIFGAPRKINGSVSICLVNDPILWQALLAHKNLLK